MKKWSFVVAGLYGLVLLALFGPMVLIALGPTFKLSEIREAMLSWQLGSMIAIMVLAQFSLLRIPAFVAARRPVTQRPLLATILAAAFMMGLLALGATASLYEFFTRRGFEMGLAPVIGLGSWIFWAVCFSRSTRRSAPDAQLSALTRQLWKGSILELLVAVPTHIVARNRDYCCAGVMTFIGLTCGISVMLFAFGPAVYFLFVERWKRLHPVNMPV